ncbi:unnamed protein product [Paramecium pentaurelia]|uniref:Photosystem I assembly protein Ycf3 n=1 Tax=Paramecium pentaurelia TaxID=43138 RepID=A0A8S1W1Y6_9CILI|nr:unnamed protein product [Paramecium pentaurelia]
MILVTKIKHQVTIIKQSNLILNMLEPYLTEVNTITLNILAILYNDIGDKDKALSDYNQAIQLDPKLVRALINRGEYYNTQYISHIVLSNW